MIFNYSRILIALLLVAIWNDAAQAQRNYCQCSIASPDRPCPHEGNIVNSCADCGKECYKFVPTVTSGEGGDPTVHIELKTGNCECKLEETCGGCPAKSACRFLFDKNCSMPKCVKVGSQAGADKKRKECLDKLPNTNAANECWSKYMVGEGLENYKDANGNEVHCTVQP